VHKLIRAFLSLMAILAVIASPNSIRARSPQNANVGEKQAAWDKLADEYFDQVFFKFSPTGGTFVGLHQYDPLLEDYSRAAVDANVAALHAFEKRVEGLDPVGLDETRTADRELVLSNIRGTLLTLETIRPWEKNPDTYSGGISNSVYVIMIRKFAPPDDRLRSVVSREQKMPAVFAAARANLKNPPRIYTEIALEQLPGIISFFQNDVPAAFAGATDPALKAEFAKSNGAVIGICRAMRIGSSQTCFRAPMETSASARTPSPRNCSTTKWLTPRSTACSKSVGPTCARTRRNSIASPKSWSPTRRQPTCWPNSPLCIPRRTNCCKAFATRSTG